MPELVFTVFAIGEKVYFLIDGLITNTNRLILKPGDDVVVESHSLKDIFAANLKLVIKCYAVTVTQTRKEEAVEEGFNSYPVTLAVKRSGASTTLKGTRFCGS